jgi:hypothetical protein
MDRHTIAEAGSLLSQARRDPRRLTVALAAVLVISLAACSSSSSSDHAASAEGKAPDGTVQLNALHAAYIGSGMTGNGMLSFNGNSYPFTVSGLGVGGLGASSIDADGEVYDLHDVSQFPGAYAQGRYGFVVGSLSGGDLWLKNGNGVVMHLKAKRTGLMLSLGGDAMVVNRAE